MASGSSTDAILAGAKKTLADVNKFASSMPSTTPHEYSNASYKMAHATSKPNQDDKEGESIASGLKWRAAQKAALQ